MYEERSEVVLTASELIRKRKRKKNVSERQREIEGSFFLVHIAGLVAKESEELKTSELKIACWNR